MNKKEREYYNINRERACKRLDITKNQYNWFRARGNELRSLYCENCNGTIEGNDYDYQTNCIEERIDARLDGLEVYFQTDPRGATIYLDKEPIPENNYTRAVCIY